MSVRRRSLIVLLGCLLTSCAHIVDPTGGPKDESAPVVVSVFPKPNSTNVRPNEVVITFDEYLKAGPVADQVFISPVPDFAPIISIQGKQLRIEFQKPLLDETTYSITVASGIRDFTEGNQISAPFQMAFSTGSVLDTVQCRGTVQDAVFCSALAGWSVGLFMPTHGDTISAYLGSKPIYLTRTNSQGMFVLPNLKSGRYQLLSWKDNDQNMAPDSLDPIALTSGNMPVMLPADTVFKMELVPISPQLPITVKTDAVAKGIYKLEFNRPCVLNDSTLLVFPSDSSGVVTGDALPVSCSPGGKVVIVFMLEQHVTHLYLPTVLDSTGRVHQIITRLPDAMTMKQIRPALVQVKYLPSYAQLVFTHPVDPVSEVLQHTMIRGNAILVPVFKQDTFTILLSAGLRFLQCSDSLTKDTVLKLPLRMFPQTGSVRVTLVSTPSADIIPWLQASDGTIVQGRIQGTQLTFNQVIPGKYFLYILEDKDYNGVRTLPSIRNLPWVRPEQMYRHPTAIEVRPNWDLEGIKVSIPW